MPEWLKVALAILVFVGLFGGAYRLLRRSQEDDPVKRGRDSWEPGGIDDVHHSSGGPD